MPGSARPVDRRELIKRAGFAGAVAWTAPLVIDSLVSPAGALTPVVQPCGCYKLHVDAKGTCLKNWDASCTDANDFCGSCCDPTLNSSAACPTGYVQTTQISTFCMTAWYGLSSPDTQATQCPDSNSPGTDLSGFPVVEFRIDPACAFIFEAGYAHVTGAGADNCPPAVAIAAGGKTITFDISTTDGNEWNEFHLCLDCP